MKLERQLFKMDRKVRRLLLVTVGLGFLAGAGVILQALFISRIVDGVFLGKQGLDTVFPLLMALLAVILVRAGLNYAGEASAARAAAEAKTTLRQRLFAHLHALGPTYTRSERSGELANTGVEGIETLDAYFSQYLPQKYLAGLVPLAILVVVAFNDLLSAVVLALTAPILPIFMILIGKMANALTQKQWRSMSQMSAHFLDVLQGLTTLKLFNRSQPQQEIIGKISDQFRLLTLKVLRVAFLSALVMEIGATISTAIIAVEVGLRLLYAQIEFQPALFVLLLAPEFYLPMRSLGAKFHAAMTGAEAVQRVFEILDTPLPTQPQNPVKIPTTQSLSFEKVVFAYSPDAPPALDGFSLTIQPGQKIALVGQSGAGKSTVARLLLRFNEPQSGEIKIGEVALSQIPAAEWREQLAWVPQNPYLFNTTIEENIKLGRENATEAEVIEAARQAQAHEFIIALPQGYQTIIGERGSRLSGGQAQRLSLARAFLKNSPLLILDEPTSNLDPETETAVIDSLEKFCRDKTVLLISHRLNTVIRADRIVVLENGQISESGAHEELAGRDGLYRELAEAHGGLS